MSSVCDIDSRINNRDIDRTSFLGYITDVKLAAVLLTLGLMISSTMRLYAQGLALSFNRCGRVALISGSSGRNQTGKALLTQSRGRRRYNNAIHASLAAIGFYGVPKLSSRPLNWTPAIESAISADCSPPEHPPA